jgi:hypothetical protein
MRKVAKAGNATRAHDGLGVPVVYRYVPVHAISTDTDHVFARFGGDMMPQEVVSQNSRCSNGARLGRYS